MATKPNSAGAAKEQFIKIPRGLMMSDAWLSMKASHLKIVSAICEEHMRKGGKENGNLKATHRQLSALGIWPGDVARLIRDLEEWGLIECQRGGMRTPIRYTLTWLPRFDGRPPSNLWQAYRTVENQKSARENEGSAARENEGSGPNLHGKTKADWPKNLHGKTKALSRIPLPRKEEGDWLGPVPGGAAVVPLPAASGKAGVR